MKISVFRHIFSQNVSEIPTFLLCLKSSRHFCFKQKKSDFKCLQCTIIHNSQHIKIFVFQKAKLLRQKKEDGNTAFKSNKLTEAYNLYTDALAIDPCNKFTNAKLFFNRATVAARVYLISY